MNDSPKGAECRKTSWAHVQDAKVRARHGHTGTSTLNRQGKKTVLHVVAKIATKPRAATATQQQTILTAQGNMISYPRRTCTGLDISLTPEGHGGRSFGSPCSITVTQPVLNLSTKLSSSSSSSPPEAILGPAGAPLTAGPPRESPDRVLSMMLLGLEDAASAERLTRRLLRLLFCAIGKTGTVKAHP